MAGRNGWPPPENDPATPMPGLANFTHISALFQFCLPGSQGPRKLHAETLLNTSPHTAVALK